MSTMKKIEGSNKKVISVQEDTKLPGTNIILEKGDKIQILNERNKIGFVDDYDEDGYETTYRVFSYPDFVEIAWEGDDIGYGSSIRISREALSELIMILKKAI